MKILAFASAGGHWVQLLRLVPSFGIDTNEIVFATTNKSYYQSVLGYGFFHVTDANRKSRIKFCKMFFETATLVVKLRPDLIITTGAAPGLIAIICAKLIGCKAVWIDSIANVDKLSLSGKIASFVADRTYTQWPHLATSKIMYKGSILS